jgi:DNA-directed RNA polymerase subunit delta
LGILSRESLQGKELFTVGGVREKLAYLRGLIRGADFYGDDEKAQEIWEGMLGVFESISDSLEMVQIQQAELEEYIEAMDADLAEIEEELYGDPDAEEYVELECPNCHEPVSVEEDFLYDDDIELSCPECGETLYPADDDDDLDDIFLDDEDDED